MAVLDQYFYQLTGPATDPARDPARDPETVPRLVFLHGVMGFAANWRTIAKAFENDFQVLTFDQRGHGRSKKPAVGYAAEDFAEDLLEIIDELNWTKINLVGHSMGGRNALAFAARYPERVERLVIEDIGPSMNHDGAAFILKILDSIPVPFADKKEATRFFESDFLEMFCDVPKKEGLAAFLRANIIEDEQKRGVWRFYVPGVREAIEQGRAEERWDQIRGLKMPTLLVRGEFSRDLPRPTFERALKENPRIVGVEIGGAGHWVHSDKPQEFIAELRRFFASVN